MKNIRGHVLFLTFLFCITLLGESEDPKPLLNLYKTGRIQLVADLAIDETLLPDDILFENVFITKMSKNGDIYFCDFKANNIKKFDRLGKFVQTIGREGQGPGEFNMPSDFAITDDRLIVWDMGNRRLCVLTCDGKFIKSKPVSMSDGLPDKMRSLPNGEIAIGLEVVRFDEPGRPQDYLIAVYTSELEQKKIIYHRQVCRNKYIRSQGMIVNLYQPFSTFIYWDVSADGRIVIGHSQKYEMRVYNSAGNELFSIIHAWQPIEITHADKIKYFVEIAPSNGEETKEVASRFIVENTQFPKHKPAFKQIVVDSEGNILVWAYRKDVEKEMKYIDAFDPQGNFLGIVQVVGEKTFPIYVAINERSFWTQESNEKGQTKMIRYRIEEAE